jgi:hypothetical protein
VTFSTACSSSATLKAASIVVDAGLRAFFFSKTAERPAAKQLGRWREASGIVAEYVDFRAP